MARGGTHIGHAVSESETLDQIIAHLTAMTPSGRADERRLAEAVDLAYALKRQATMGVHRNAPPPRTYLTQLEAKLGSKLSADDVRAFQGQMPGHDAELWKVLPADSDAAVALVELARFTRGSGKYDTNRRRNPTLALFGNPGRVKRAIACGEVLSHNVQAVLYVRDDDGEEYAHGYGLDDDNDLKLNTHRDGSVTIGGLKRETGFALVGLPSGEVVICDAVEVDE